MTLTATEAKNRFGQVLEQAQKRPVFIEKAGRRHSVVMSVEQYDALLAAQRGAAPGDDAASEFTSQYQEWVEQQQRHFEEFGCFGAEWRSW